MSTEPAKVDLESSDVVAAKREAFEELFPGAVVDGVLDTERVGELLDVDLTQSKVARERFGLMWAGKNEALHALMTPSRASLTPDVERSVDFDKAANVFIQGDSLEVLKLLQKAYNDRVKLIYIDPPYNTGKNDFIYDDDFVDGLRGYLEFTGQVDEQGRRTRASAETTGRFHSRWINFMYSRLVLARNLLRQDGIILVSIDDHEVASLRFLLEEIFGEKNFLATLVWDRGHSQQQGQFKEYHEYVLAFARDRSLLEGFKDPSGGEVLAGAIKKPSRANPISEFTFPAGIRVDAPNGTEFSGTWGGAETTTLVRGRFTALRGVTTEPVTLAAAWTQKGQMQAFFYENGDVTDTRGQKVLEFYFSNTGKLKYRKERTALTPATVQRWGTQGAATGALSEILGPGIFDLPKPVGMIKDFVAWATDEGDVVLDFFAGSGTTAHAVALQNASDGKNRHWVLVNLPEETDPASAAHKAGFETVSDITVARLDAVLETVDGARESGLRTYSLDQSNFRASKDSDGQLDLSVSTLAWEETDWVAVAAEVLLKEGVSLHEAWETHDLSGAKVVTSGGVAVVLTDEINYQLVEETIDLQPAVLVFMEDGFAGRDAMKANAVTNARSLGITLKTV